MPARSRDMAQVTSQTHTKWLREEFRWNTIEPSPGQFDFSYYDHFMLIAAQAGEHVLPRPLRHPVLGRRHLQHDPV